MAKAVYTLELVTDVEDEDVEEFKTELENLENNKEAKEEFLDYVVEVAGLEKDSIRNVKVEVEE